MNMMTNNNNKINLAYQFQVFPSMSIIYGMGLGNSSFSEDGSNILKLLSFCEQ